jgi:uncharacterized protein YjbI with pentapeptide repeats
VNFQGANLSRVDFEGKDLQGMNFSGVNFSRANLAGANLTSAQLDHSNLTGANFSNANLSKVSTRGVTGDGTTFRGAYVVEADFSGAQLGHCSFFEAVIEGSTFTEVGMENVNLNSARVKESSFARSHLPGSSFIEASFESCNFQEAVLERGNLRATKFTNCSLRKASFGRSLLQNMELVDLEMDGADFHRASLINVKFASLRLGGATLDSVDCRDSEMSEVNLRDGQIVQGRFRGTDFRSVIFSGSLIKDTRFTDCMLNSCEFIGVGEEDLRTCEGLDLKTLVNCRFEPAEDAEPALGETTETGAIDPAESPAESSTASSTASSAESTVSFTEARILDSLGPPEAERTCILKGSPWSELDVGFGFSHLTANELARFLLSFENLYNHVLRVARGLGNVSEISFEDRLRVVRVELSNEAAFSFRGSSLSPTVSDGNDHGIPDARGVLAVVREICQEAKLSMAEDCFKSLGTMAASIKASRDGDTTEENSDDAQRVQDQLEELRERLRGKVANLLPSASAEEVGETIEIVLQLPGDIFNRPNLFNLTL